jgi:hypothetical protein
LVNSCKEGSHLSHSLAHVVYVDAVVAVEHFAGGVTGNSLDYGLGNSGFTHVGIEAVAGVMENKAILFEALEPLFSSGKPVDNPVMDLAGPLRLDKVGAASFPVTAHAFLAFDCLPSVAERTFC